MANDYYQTLGVQRQASPKEIQSAYRRLARKYHPDVTGGDTAAEERFKTINEAHEVLSDKAKRAAYDKWGDRWMQAAQVDQVAQQRGVGGGPRGIRFEFGGGAGGLGAAEDGVFGDVVAQFVSGAVRDARFDPPAGHPDGEGLGVMVPPEEF